jgi:hypothetical protein
MKMAERMVPTRTLGMIKDPQKELHDKDRTQLIGDIPPGMEVQHFLVI